jgi:glycosyltransferase involved in cell wall biosynthesis
MSEFLRWADTDQPAAKIRLAATLLMRQRRPVPLVSVILPTRDRPDLLTRAVQSVLAQAEKDLELLVVDNNRDSAPVAEDPAFAPWRADPRVRVLRSGAAQNAAAARNAGLAMAKGTWIAYLDDDDAYRPRKLSAQIAAAGGSPLVLCGALVHLRGRTRAVQTAAASFSGDGLLNDARWQTSLLMHRREPALSFDESLFAAEDLHFGLAAAARLGVREVPVAAEPLVDVYQDRQDSARTNLRAAEGWRASRRTLVAFGREYSRGARRLFLLRAMAARAKLERDPLGCLRLAPSLVREGGAGQLRYLANALAVSSGLVRGRFVT